ncbi:DUF4861 domain-containing protein [Sphingobacterium corticibacterium]|uniref:DUF4861 domain-containing protein n=2 Tax=Sphingobacterium corticibacterium TaxID=2484746 RepID=A0A4Q6XLU6_9SPHI|nr:DUF4861 domain-containing protein [Sphingobacterium corticibacterium]
MKYLFFLGCTALLALSSCSQREEIKIITLKNTDSVDLWQKAIVVQRLDLTNDKKFYPLLLDAKGDTIPSQVDDTTGDGEWDELFFLIDIPALGEVVLTAQHTDDSIAYEQKTAVRFGKRDGLADPVQPRLGDTLYADQLPLSIGYQPYQTDGPSWENDKVGFRHYLDGRNSKDVFGKKVSYMSPSDVGINAQGAVEDNYHVMLDWGRDIMPVGNSVGIGGIALANGDTMYRIGVTALDAVNNVDTTIFRVVGKGPLRSAMDIQYRNWEAGGRYYSLTEQPIIWAGMYGYQNTVRAKGMQERDTLLVGLVNIFSSQPPKEIIIDNQWVVLYTHDRQSYDQEWWLGLGLILPYDRYKGYTEAPKIGPLVDSYMAKLDISDDAPVSYYAVAGWELSDEGFRNRDYFEDYIVDLAKQLTAKVVIEISTANELQVGSEK